MAAAHPQTHPATTARGDGNLADVYASSTRARSPRGDWLAPAAMLAVPLFIALFDNHPLWSRALAVTVGSPHQGAILLSLFAVVFFPLVIVLALCGRRTLKVVGAAFLLVAAITAFFMNEYGIVIDDSMIRNVVETEVQEASPLLTGALVWHVVMFGLVPAAVLILAPLRGSSVGRAIAGRAVIIALGAATLVGVLYSNYATLSSFTQRNHAMRLLVNPGYPIYSYLRFLATRESVAPEDREPIEAAVKAAYGARSKRTLLVLVLGETARADRFSLNGYERDTNRYTASLDVVNFADVASCGTSTADSVPCIFSSLGHAQFTHAAAAESESLFGSLGRLGVHAYWRDNSTGCKEVCDSGHFTEYAGRADPELCNATGCFDEILLEDFASLVADADRDQFVVLHQRGSHGPAYSTDTPRWIKTFLPECTHPSPRDCGSEEIDNAYDNTILYTDYFVSRVIALAADQADRFETAVLYVSDHGESLGENGLYLHGFPYAIAPREQTRVPMLFWASEGFYAANGLSRRCVRESASRPATHDSVYHTLLALYGVDSPRYSASLDLFAPCREAPRPGSAPSVPARAVTAAARGASGVTVSQPRTGRPDAAQRQASIETVPPSRWTPPNIFQAP